MDILDINASHLLNINPCDVSASSHEKVEWMHRKHYSRCAAGKENNLQITIFQPLTDYVNTSSLDKTTREYNDVMCILNTTREMQQVFVFLVLLGVFLLLFFLYLTLAFLSFILGPPVFASSYFSLLVPAIVCLSVLPSFSDSLFFSPSQSRWENQSLTCRFSLQQLTPRQNSFRHRPLPPCQESVGLEDRHRGSVHLCVRAWCVRCFHLRGISKDDFEQRQKTSIFFPLPRRIDFSPPIILVSLSQSRNTSLLLPMLLFCESMCL